MTWPRLASIVAGRGADNRNVRSYAWCPLLLVLAGCAIRPGATPQPFPRHHLAPADRPVTAGPGGRPAPGVITSTALEYLGVPYRWGGATPKGFDCSGFTYYVFHRHGMELPRVAADQYGVGTPVDRTAVRPGDLLFFETIAEGPSHVALALDGDQFVHAPSRRGKVRVERLSSHYWAGRFLGARRVL